MNLRYTKYWLERGKYGQIRIERADGRKQKRKDKKRSRRKCFNCLSIIRRSYHYCPFCGEYIDIYTRF